LGDHGVDSVEAEEGFVKSEEVFDVALILLEFGLDEGTLGFESLGEAKEVGGDTLGVGQDRLTLVGCGGQFLQVLLESAGNSLIPEGEDTHELT
jgi:hypothetical protein